jgi:hypothetical protein
MSKFLFFLGFAYENILFYGIILGLRASWPKDDNPPFRGGAYAADECLNVVPLQLLLPEESS